MSSLLTVDQYIARSGQQVPTQEDGTADRTRIQEALNSASDTCRSYLTRDLLHDDGSPVAQAPPRLAGVLPRIVTAIAAYDMLDGATGAEDTVRSRFKDAIAQLERLAGKPDRPQVKARIIPGSGGWIRRPPSAQAVLEQETLRLQWRFEQSFAGAGSAAANLGAWSVLSGDPGRITQGTDSAGDTWVRLPAGQYRASVNVLTGGAATTVALRTAALVAQRARSALLDEETVTSSDTWDREFDLPDPAWLYVVLTVDRAAMLDVVFLLQGRD